MEHGGNITDAAAAYGIDLSEMIDLSTGISPRSYPVDSTMVSARDWRHLPQSADEINLIKAMRDAWGIDSAADIALAPGSSLLISLAARLRDHTEVMIPDPVYSEHEKAWGEAGHRIQFYAAGTCPVLTDAAGVVIAVQPGNPMGDILPPEAWHGLIDDLARRDGLLIMDEAFIDLMPHHTIVGMAGRKGLLILRSFGKFYGLAGLRLGAAVGHGDDIALLRRLLGPWSVSTPALRVGAMAIADQDWADGQRQWLREQMSALRQVLTKAGMIDRGGTDLYALMDVEKMELENASGLHHHLAKQGIWTRIFDHHPRWMRFGLPANAEERQRLEQALVDWQGHGK